ncbi:diguanylate cyclase [Serratia liquefaciens]|uniref:diguanylate cyclase n=1 Tax=Serratia liquefaciens TaxID=614 RepID=UPI00101EF567|nr:diguanylate cyclase [Serratia liquefaciens]MBF8103931.1 diguanylate cyclase [Serratia liquefaciens]RYM59259.1 diguanylate cyclase AdrA [Serratia liquefaciens]CAB1211618.1 putative diguanylate cyclase AdrA [Serratia liquefaciens]
MYKPSVIDTRKSGLSFARRTYLPRIVGLGIGSLCVFSVFYTQNTALWLWVLLILHGFIWPHLAYQWARRSSQPFKAEIRNLLIDSFFGGLWVAMMAFNALPSVVILSMMGMNNIAAAGKPLFFKGLTAQLAGALTIGALMGFPFQPESTASQVYLCLPMIYLYPILLGLVTYRTAKRLAEKKQELLRISMRDGLTGLYNRRHWEHLLHHQFDSCRRYQHTATLILMDIDRFKTINDTFGHALGDEALAVLAEELLIGLRAVDIVGRYGGDEFGAVLPNTSAEQASIALLRIQERLNEVIFREAPQLRLNISAGIADYHGEMSGYLDWLKAADNALYRAKNNGRNRLELAVPGH